MIFVFGSNLAGRHGAGAARYAMEHKGAIPGEGFGLYRLSYAIPTKSATLRTLPIDSVRYYVNCFIEDARRRPDLEFQVTRVGCGLAGYTDKEMAPLFVNAGPNCLFDEAWRPFLGEDRRYWGTF